MSASAESGKRCRAYQRERMPSHFLALEHRLRLLAPRMRECARMSPHGVNYCCSGSGMEWNKTTFHSPPSRRNTIVVGAEMC